MKYLRVFNTNEERQEFEQTVDYWPIVTLTKNGQETVGKLNYYDEEDVVITPTSKPKINFIVNGITYEAENSMTWEDWVNSEYNTGSFTIPGNYVYGGVYTHTIVYNRDTYQNVNKNDTIISGGIYAYDNDSPNHGGGMN